MKPLLYLLASLTAVSALATSCATRGRLTADYEVVPLPAVIEPVKGDSFVLGPSTVIVYTPGDSLLASDARLFAGYLTQLTGLTPKVEPGTPGRDRIALLATLDGDNPEAYRLKVGTDGITVNGVSAAGTFYGLQTLRKSIPVAGDNNVVFPGVTISDQPRFSYRGAHLDVCRHFFPLDSVKTFIDMLALHNINTFHWHLSDDQGWRIEIKSRPGLTALGSERTATVLGHNSGKYDSIPYGGFFTQDEAREIVRYAAERHITVVPEIDMPGHMQAALRAYPHLGCTGGPYEVWRDWGVSEEVLCAGNDSTYRFIDDVLGEIIDIFPSRYIHVGGDECPKLRWEQCPKCQAKIKQLGFKADDAGTPEEKLQSHLIHHASEFLTSHGRNMIGWDETLEGGLAPGAIVMSWRGQGGGIEAARRGHDVIMTPNDYFYFDYYQSIDRDREPDAIGGYVPLEKVYSFTPVPDELSPEEGSHIVGVQANLWTEYIPTFSQVQYMELPRMGALAEVQWSDAPKDYEEFTRRLARLINHYEAAGYNYARHLYDVTGDITPDINARALALTLSTVDGAPVHYTLDGSDPSAASPLYTGPVMLGASADIKAVALRGQETSRPFTARVNFNKATCCPVTLVTPPHPRYAAGGGAILTDGKRARGPYHSGEWLGYAGHDLIAVVDLGRPQQVSRLTIHTNVETGAWIFDARAIKVEVSDDGGKYLQVASCDYGPMTEGRSSTETHTLDFPPVEARYVKLTVTPEAAIPSWHPGAGAPGFVFIDEIELD